MHTIKTSEKREEMIHINHDDIKKYGGFLNALNHTSFIYLHCVLGKYRCFKQIDHLKKLDQIILHIDPHLDEYFASLLFLSSLPHTFRKTVYKETALHSEHHNPQLHSIVPNAAIFGIGSVGKLGEKALYSFDEHVQGGMRRDPSCTSLVRKMRFNGKLPVSFQTLIQEVDEIDSKGGAHEQSIGNLIKRGHDIQVLIKNSHQTFDEQHEWLSPFWKWTIMNACLTATIYCLEEKVPWTISGTNELIKKSLAHFTEHSNFSQHPEFNAATQWMRQSFHGQKTVFDKAILRSIDHHQTLILGKVCVSLHHCYGQRIMDAIMVHFWEIIYHNQRNYLRLNTSYDSIFQTRGNQTIMNNFGFFEKRENPVSFFPALKGASPKSSHLKFWILFIEPLPSVTSINQAFNTLLKKHNHGFGLIYIWNAASGSIALFKGTGVPLHIWAKLKTVLKTREPKRWHDEGFDHFILNGNKTHQYVDRTDINLDELEKIIRQL